MPSSGNGTGKMKNDPKLNKPTNKHTYNATQRIQFHIQTIEMFVFICNQIWCASSSLLHFIVHCRIGFHCDAVFYATISSNIYNIHGVKLNREEEYESWGEREGARKRNFPEEFCRRWFYGQKGREACSPFSFSLCVALFDVCTFVWALSTGKTYQNNNISTFECWANWRVWLSFPWQLYLTFDVVLYCRLFLFPFDLSLSVLFFVVSFMRPSQQRANISKNIKLLHANETQASTIITVIAIHWNG